MTATGSDYRLDGIYKQRQEGFFMQRVKLPAGVISATQAATVAAVSTRFGQGTVHLTTRGSMEIHWLKETDLPQVKCELAKAGLTSRGACGGAVRGITCGSQGALGFPVLESFARRLHRHFAGNPRFERLPKKFKIGLEADVVGGRHLIQDVGLVLVGVDEGGARYDIWIAGGLGREPQAGFLFAEDIAEERIVAIIEAILTVYAAHAPPPKRLKYLANKFGKTELSRTIKAEPVFSQVIPPVKCLPENLIDRADGRQRLELPVFTGKLTASQLGDIASAAEKIADGMLMVTPDQNIALLLSDGVDADVELNALQHLTGLALLEPALVLRVCPGSHECLMGLTATRDVAGQLAGLIGERGRALKWALSGCHNSCTQPQLADVGIVSSSLHKDESGQRTPRFDLYRLGAEGLGTATAKSLTLDELCQQVREIA